VDADEVHAALGEDAGLLAERFGLLARRPVDRPEPLGLPRPGMDEAAVLHADEAAVSGLPFVEGAKVDAAGGAERIGRRGEREPAAVGLRGAAGDLGELVGSGLAVGSERLDAQYEAVEVAVVAVRAVESEGDRVGPLPERHLAGVGPGDEPEVGLA